VWRSARDSFWAMHLASSQEKKPRRFLLIQACTLGEDPNRSDIAINSPNSPKNSRRCRMGIATRVQIANGLAIRWHRVSGLGCGGPGGPVMVSRADPVQPAYSQS
jgi:hypothetical protein